MHITSHNGLSRRGPSVLRSLWTMFVALGSALRRRLVARRRRPATVGAPERLSDRQLKDIGLDRARIFAALHGRRG